jgi:AcrR family transcriptional regulator
MAKLARRRDRFVEAPPRGRADKREAIARAARDVFGRAGYARTSIDAIAAEAGVSTRTIYNHFDGKEQLFSAVLLASATQVADAFAEEVGRRLTGADPERDLVALGRAFAAQRRAVPEHFALLARIAAEAPHFPPEVIEAWQEAGPRRVQRELAARLDGLAAGGRLDLDGRPRAASHVGALVTAGLATQPFGAPPPTEEETDATVAAGVEAFLHGYGRRRPG